MALGVGAGVALERLGGELVEPDPADRRGGAAEVAIDQLAVEPDGLEDLRPAVGGDRRDPHLRHHLEQALADRLQQPLERLLVGDARGQLGATMQIGERLEQQIGVDRGGAVADQRRKVVVLARLAGLDHEAGLQPGALVDQVLVHRAERQHRGDRHPVGAEAAVGDHDQVRRAGDRGARLARDPVERRLEPALAGLQRPGGVEGGRAQRRVRGAGDPLELGVGEHRVLEHELHRVLGTLGEHVALGADPRLEAHHDRLADRVDRRVGDLSESLLEVREQRRLLLRERREGEVVAHRAGRLEARLGRGRDQHPQVLLAVAEGELAAAQRLGRRQRSLLVEVVEPDLAVRAPVAVGALAGDLELGLAVGVQEPALQVDDEQPARVQAPAADDLRRVDRQHAGLGPHHDQALVGDHPAPGAEAVAVEAAADHPPVGEGHRGGAVPGLDHRRAVAVEALELRRHVVAVLVGSRDHHHHRLGQRPAGEREQLEHPVEGGRVGAALGDQRQAPLEVGAEELGVQRRLAGAHPVDVAGDRVDLAVVGEQPQRLGQLPAREGVGREARVDDGERALQLGIAQVGVEPRQLRRAQHPLVDHGPGAEAGDRERRARLELGDPAGDEQPPLELVLVDHVGAGADQQLAELGGDVAGGLAAAGQVDRDLAPAERLLAGLDHRLLEQPLLRLPQGRVAGEEAAGDRDAARVGQLRAGDPELAGAGAQEAVRELDQDPGAVAGARVGAGGAAVLEVVERGQRQVDDVVARLPVEARDEGDAAGVVFV